MFLNSTVLFSFSFSYDYSRDMLASPSSIKAVLQFIGLDETGLVRLLSSYFKKNMIFHHLSILTFLLQSLISSYDLYVFVLVYDSN